MASFPVLSYGGQVAMYGTSRTITYPTQVIRYRTGEEQRWVSGQPLATEMELQFSEMSQYDLGNIRAFFLSNVGAFNSTWSITIDGVTYANMAFVGDAFAPTLSPTPDRWNLSLKVKQTI
jgi:hypothetical protein